MRDTKDFTRTLKVGEQIVANLRSDDSKHTCMHTHTYITKNGPEEDQKLDGWTEYGRD